MTRLAALQRWTEARNPRRVLTAPPPPVVYRWDLDKTYLKSDFESLRKMMRVPFERAEDKVDAPGVAALIRTLRQSAKREGRPAFVYFISASPPQIGRAIREKLALDGVDVDGIVFKDQLQHLVRGRFRLLREQVGFKLAELLKARLAAPPDAIEYLFGDDWESDPVIYSLYADVLAGRLTPDALTELLIRLRIDPLRLIEINDLRARLTHSDCVRRIFINLERRTPPGHFESFGPRLVPTFNYFQTALVLHEEATLPIDAVVDVGRSLMQRSSYTPERLRNSLDDLVRRGYVGIASSVELRRELEEAGVLPLGSKRAPWHRRVWRRLRRRPPAYRILGLPAAPAVTVDYSRLIDSWLASGGRPGTAT